MSPKNTADLRRIFPQAREYFFIRSSGGAISTYISGRRPFSRVALRRPQVGNQGSHLIQAALRQGLHLLLLGYLVFKSGYAPKWLGIVLGILLAFAGLGYLADSFGTFLNPNYNISIAQFAFIGEVLLIFWLLWKGIKGFGEKPE
jgi:hypothetical protein